MDLPSGRRILSSAFFRYGLFENNAFLGLVNYGLPPACWFPFAGAPACWLPVIVLVTAINIEVVIVMVGAPGLAPLSPLAPLIFPRLAMSAAAFIFAIPAARSWLVISISTRIVILNAHLRTSNLIYKHTNCSWFTYMVIVVFFSRFPPLRPPRISSWTRYTATIPVFTPRGRVPRGFRNRFFCWWACWLIPPSIVVSVGRFGGVPPSIVVSVGRFGSIPPSIVMSVSWFRR